MMAGCKKCRMVGAVLFLVAGIALLLKDMNVWNFWNISGWSVLFILLGLGGVGQCCCPECQAACETKKK